MSAKSVAANLITGVRILCSIALLFCQPFSPPFIHRQFHERRELVCEEFEVVG